MQTEIADVITYIHFTFFYETLIQAVVWETVLFLNYNADMFQL